MSFVSWNDPFDIFFAPHKGYEVSTNVGHNSKEVILQLALPGFSRSDIDVEVNGGRLAVRAKTQQAKEDYEWTTRNISLTDYSRSWSLPKNANTDAVDATYESGILTVRIPYVQSTRETARKIELR